MFNYKKTYYKVTNGTENHNGLQYKTGLNEDILPFDDNPEHSCVPGGIYFTDINHIGEFYNYGEWVRPLKIPKNQKVILDPEGDKWRSHSVIMLERIDKVAFLKRLPKKYKSSLDVSGCDLKGVTLPQTVGGSLYVSGCDESQITEEMRAKYRIAY